MRRIGIILGAILAIAITSTTFAGPGELNTLRLSWDEGDNEPGTTGTRVYFRETLAGTMEDPDEGAVGWQMIAEIPPGVMTWTVTNVGSAGFYTVTAFNIAGESTFSNAVDLPAAPTNSGRTLRIEIVPLSP
jgi:hypothetical protein